MRRTQYVSGHYRTSKNGKTYWVEGHVRNDPGPAPPWLSGCMAVLALSIAFIVIASVVSSEQTKRQQIEATKPGYAGPWGLEWWQREANRSCRGWATVEKFGGGPEPWFCAHKCDVLKKCDITREQFDEWQRAWSQRYGTGSL